MTQLLGRSPIGECVLSAAHDPAMTRRIKICQQAALQRNVYLATLPRLQEDFGVATQATRLRTRYLHVDLRYIRTCTLARVLYLYGGHDLAVASGDFQVAVLEVRIGQPVAKGKQRLDVACRVPA